MFTHKKHSAWQRLVMFMRDIASLARCAVTCPICASDNVSGGGGSYFCHKCSSLWQG